MSLPGIRRVNGFRRLKVDALELGYFDGRRNGRVGILPILDSPGDAFRGLEYLGLYQILEDITFEYSGSKIARWTGPSEAEPLREMARAA